jgi:transposase
MLAAVRLTGMFALMTIEGGTSGPVFSAFVEHVLAPALLPGDIVVLDNLGAHKVGAVAAAITAVGASMKFLPPYSPDLNPIEPCWSVVKRRMRELKPRTIDALDDAFVSGAALVDARMATNMVRHCGYVTQEAQPR